MDEFFRTFYRRDSIMDKIQQKMSNLLKNIHALEVCLLTGEVDMSDLILYLQYDIPIENSNKIFSSMSSYFQRLYGSTHNNNLENYETLEGILRDARRYIVSIDMNGNQAQEVYSEANNVAEKICILIDEESLRIRKEGAIIKEKIRD
jgi:hypothetical protein